MTCTRLDAFFDGELPATDADAFRTHLATCDRCQLQLRGRMQEALVVDEAAPAAQIIPIARARKRYVAAITVVAAAAAAALIVWTLRSPSPPPRVATAEPTLAVTVHDSPTVVRGDAVLAGSKVDLESSGLVWVYFADRELVARCAQRCTVAFDRIGTYTVVAIALGSITPIAGAGLDDDLARAGATGAKYRSKTIQVTPRPGNVP